MDDISQAIELASQYHNAGQLDKAQSIYQDILQQAPQHSDAWHLLGVIALQRQDYPRAMDFIQRAMALRHDVAIFHNSLASVFLKIERFYEAIACLQRALALQPSYKEAYLNLAQAYTKLNRFEEAIECYRKVLAFYPQEIDILYLLGNALGNQKHFEEAMVIYQHALHLNPHHEGILDNLGKALYAQHRFTEALACYQKIIERSPKEADGYVALGKLALIQGKTGQTLQAYQTALELSPHSLEASMGILSCLLYSVENSATTIFLAHQKFDEQLALPLASQITPHRRPCHLRRKLKLGYVSADFYQHVVSHFIEPILLHHDHQQFEIFCYYNNDKHDHVTQRLQHYADHFVHCLKETDEALAEQIRQDQIDILVDLMGYTWGNRFAVFARKPAPVQAAYLGYSNTTGLTAMDYRITDRYADPPQLVTNSSEVLVRMPDSYFCYQFAEDLPEVNALPALSKGYITFGSLNNHSKLNLQLFTWWAEILQAVPNSKLLIKTKALTDPLLRQEFITQFTHLGIGPERLIIAAYVQFMGEHLSTYHHIDIGLDSYPYNGATTTCEALSMGVPVVTLVGDRHVSRMGSSLLHTLGLTEWITQTPQEYIHQCVRLSHRIDDLSQLRQTLRERMQASALMAGQIFTAHLETAYQKMWQTWCAQSTSGDSHEISSSVVSRSFSILPEWTTGPS